VQNQVSGNTEQRQSCLVLSLSVSDLLNFILDVTDLLPQLLTLQEGIVASYTAPSEDTGVCASTDAVVWNSDHAQALLEQGPHCIFRRTLRQPVLRAFPCLTFSAHAFPVVGVMLSDNYFSIQTYRYLKDLLPARHDAGAFLAWVLNLLRTSL